MKMNYVLTTVAVVTISLTGCGAIDSIKEQRAAAREAREKSRFDVAAVLCERYGFKSGTDAFAQCLQTEVIQMKNREAVAESASETQKVIKDAASKTEDAIKTRQAK
jgi:hypothetical protein